MPKRIRRLEEQDLPTKLFSAVDCGLHYSVFHLGAHCLALIIIKSNTDAIVFSLL
jgi:hypothetical protein